MAEIRDGVFVRNETNENSMGGTERMTMELAERVNKDLLKECQIVSSRVRELQEDKVRIFWAHDLPGDPESEFLKDKDEQEKFHKFVFVSNWQMQGYMQAYGIPWSKCVVLHNAIDPIEEHEKPDTKDGVNIVYTPTPHRGLQILIPVFQALCEKHDNIHLDVFSSFKLYGWEQRDEQFKDLFDKMDEHPHITNHGTVDNSVIRDTLKKSHIFAYPSIWAETSCLCLMEAMSAGLICIHSNYAALPETAANWNQMYQLHEDVNQHAGIFYNILDNAVTKAKENYQPNSSASSYSNVFYGWERRTHEWNAMLTSLIENTKDRSIQGKMFRYGT